jgi:hypothetical protein
VLGRPDEVRAREQQHERGREPVSITPRGAGAVDRDERHRRGGEPGSVEVLVSAPSATTSAPDE